MADEGNGQEKVWQSIPKNWRCSLNGREFLLTPALRMHVRRGEAVLEQLMVDEATGGQVWMPLPVVREKEPLILRPV